MFKVFYRNALLGKLVDDYGLFVPFWNNPWFFFFSIHSETQVKENIHVIRVDDLQTYSSKL